MYDTIIVGAGSAGCVIANRLAADETRKILILEAGHDGPLASRIPSDWSSMLNTNVDWGYYTEPQAGCRGRRIFWPRGKMVGGSGEINAMIYMRGLPSDYDGWEAAGCAGWSWKDVLPYFLKSENNSQFTDSPYHGTSGPLHIGRPPYVDKHELMWIEAAKAAGFKHNDDPNGESQEGVGLFQCNIKDGERWGPRKAFLEPVLGQKNVTLRKGIRVTGLVIEKGRVTGVKYLANGVPETAHADSEVIMAAGSIGTPHIMMLSGIGPADELSAVGVEPVHDLPGVGKHLQDHLTVSTTFCTKASIGIGAWTAETMDASLREWTEHRTGIRTSAWVYAAGHVKTREGIEPDIQVVGTLSTDRDHGRYLGDHPGITGHCVLQRPNSRGEITLRSADPLENPAIDPKYFISDPDDIDISTMVEGLKINRRIMAQSPIRELIDYELSPCAEAKTDEELAHYVRGHFTTLFHPTSTCRMGMDRLSVTDPATMKVHGLEGIYVVDASAIPIIVSGNTHAPTIMVAERAADKILTA